ncbi:MAG: FeoB-associated Cys-rich membrane protein [Lachnospiraceae bacterium]|nr:FeoB-associated Cys-rich membrane protein [Lachnospiraceae bacterium]
MITWITANIGNIVVSLILIAMVTAVIFKMIKDKKNGSSSCKGECKSCKRRKC